jgi:hypothetical protein
VQRLAVAFVQAIEQPPPMRIGEGVEDMVEVRETGSCQV